MQWVWQLPSWPKFEFDERLFRERDQHFAEQAGLLKGSIKHLTPGDNQSIQIEILVQESINTSQIEGEILQRDSVQSSIQKHLGLHTEAKKLEPKAYGITEMMVDLYQHYSVPLNHHLLFKWHQMVCNGRRDLIHIGNYRTHQEPMHIVSSNLQSPKIYYEAPPSFTVTNEMQSYIQWFNLHLHNKEVPTLVLASLAHLYFEQIHPFEDGNGRIGRALAEKVLSMRLGYPSLTSFSTILESNRKNYYAEIQKCNHSLKTNDWIDYFSTVILKGQTYSIRLVDFVIHKNKFFQMFAPVINDRQKKVILRIFDEGPEGFIGGLNASNYQRIAKTSSATATRDLIELTALGILEKRGILKGSRYYLNLENLP